MQFLAGDGTGMEHGGEVTAKLRQGQLTAQVHLQTFLHHAAQNIGSDEGLIHQAAAALGAWRNSSSRGARRF